MNLPGVIFGVIVFAVVLALFIGFILALIKWVSRRNSRIEGLLTGLFILWLIYPFFVSHYPVHTSVITIDDRSVTVDPKKADTIVMVNKWEKISGIGNVYFKKIDNVAGQELRIYFRTLGLNPTSPWSLDPRLELKDDQGNVYKSAGGGQNSGLLFSSGVMEFRPQGNIGRDFILVIGGKQIELK